MTAANVRMVNAVAVRFDEREMSRERAIVTISFIYVIYFDMELRCKSRGERKNHTPGMKANILGTVLPIQKGKWNREHVRRMKNREVRWPKGWVMVHRRKMRERSVRVDRTRQTVDLG